MTDRHTPAEWASYFMPGTDTLVNLPGLTEPAALRLFERIAADQAERDLRRNPQHSATFDLEHLQAIHGLLFADVFPFAGQLRYVDLQKPGQTGEPFLLHAWIPTYAAVVADQLRAEGLLTDLTDPALWADRAAYFVAAQLHAHPFREGTGRAVRIWAGELAQAAGHELDWTRSDPARNVHTARAAAHANYEPMRALLTQVADGTLGVDRPVQALDDLDAALRAQAWACTGLTFGDEEDRERIRAKLPGIDAQVATVRAHLAALPEQVPSRGQPAQDRWAGFAAALDPQLVTHRAWPSIAEAMDRVVADGVDVTVELPKMLAALDTEPGNLDLDSDLEDRRVLRTQVRDGEAPEARQSPTDTTVGYLSAPIPAAAAEPTAPATARRGPGR
jgi:cell filamentation protein